MSRRTIEATIRTIERGLARDTTDPLNPNSSAAAKRRILERERKRLENH